MAPDQQLQQTRVLIVDDSPLNLRTVSCLLERLGCRTAVAESGEQALELLRSDDFDLVLMDCLMPGMDGYQTTGLIRAPDSRTRNPEVPVVALTARVDLACRERCREAGMNDFVEKPVNRPRLEAVLERWVTGRIRDE